jgi:hypothetical protein
MTTAASTAGHSPQQFQFTLGTLLLGMTWAGLVCVALRSPTAFWSGALFVLTLLVLLTVVLVAVYRAGRTRAFAVGFLVFSVGYLACLAVVAGSLSGALGRGWTPVAGASDWLYHVLHPPITVTEPGPGPGMAPGGMGTMGSGDSGMMPGGEGAGPMGPYGPTGPAGTITYTKDPPYNPQDFSTICNLAVACLLGVIGGAVAQMLNATRPGEQREFTRA